MRHSRCGMARVRASTGALSCGNLGHAQCEPYTDGNHHAIQRLRHESLCPV